MQHKPGSFTKNFGWETTSDSLLRLHTAIRAGFNGELTPVSRDTWRAQAGLPDSDRELIALNFFLHNEIIDSVDFVPVDELVLQAVKSDHTAAFDHLALFALHLNRAGQRHGHHCGEAQPITWANEFVREQLWQHGSWVADVLNKPTIDQNMATRIDGVPETVDKCVSNYRRIFTLCGFDVDGTGPLFSPADAITPAACFLLWDRLTLDGDLAAEATADELAQAIAEHDVHRLLGTSWGALSGFVTDVAEDYIAADGRARLNPLTIAAPPEGTILPGFNLKQFLDQQKSDASVARRSTTVQRQERNRKLVTELKLAYRNTCMFCREQLTVNTAPMRHHTEAAHIRPLGSPHDGPDVLSNMIVLCPNHHLQFDGGVLRLRIEEGRFRISSKIETDPLHGAMLDLAEDHSLELEHVMYHFNMHARI